MLYCIDRCTLFSYRSLVYLRCSSAGPIVRVRSSVVRSSAGPFVRGPTDQTDLVRRSQIWSQTEPGYNEGLASLRPSAKADNTPSEWMWGGPGSPVRVTDNMKQVKHIWNVASNWSDSVSFAFVTFASAPFAIASVQSIPFPALPLRSMLRK